MAALALTNPRLALAANDRNPPKLWNEHVRFGLGAAIRRLSHERQQRAGSSKVI